MPEDRLSRSPELMHPAETVLCVVDLQGRLLAAQRQAERIVWNCRRLADGAAAMGVAIAASEQAPGKLGPTVEELAQRLPAPTEKADFSVAACGDLIDSWREARLRHVVLVGIETHVCVAQSAFDLLAEGFEPKVVVDAVGSRHAIDHDTALRRFEASAVGLTTTEAVLFEWCATSEHPAFKTVSDLAKETPPAAGS